MLDKIWSRGCELWCFHDRRISGSTVTFSTLAGIFGETGSKIVLELVYEPVLELVSKPVLELVLKSVQEELG